WRRRRPHALSLIALTLGLLVTGLTVAMIALLSDGQRRLSGEIARSDGQALRENKRYDEAIRTLSRGLALTEGVSGTGQLRQDLSHELLLAQQSQAAQELHQLVDQIRFRYAADSLLVEGLRDLEASCRKAWQARERITDRLAELPPDERQRIQTD